MDVSVFEQLDESVACYELDGTIVYLNPVAVRVLGRPLAELVGQNIWELVPSERDGAFHHAFRRVAETGISEHIEQASVRSRRFWIAQIMRVNGQIWMVGRDASAEKEATTRLEVLATASHLFASASTDSTGGFRTIAEHVGRTLGDLCSIRLVSDDGTIIEPPVSVYDADPEVVAILQGAPPVAIDDPTGAALAQARSTLVSHADPDVIATRIAPPGQEERIRALGIHSAMVVPMRTESQVVGFVSVCRRARGTTVAYSTFDLRLLEELADRAALVVNQWRTLRSLRQAVAIRDEFVSVASHELRTPLAALELQLDSLQRTLAGLADQDALVMARIQRQIANARRQSDRLTALTGTLLDVTRLASRRIELVCETFDLGELAREITERFEAQAARAGCTLDLQLDGELRGSWDRNRLDQVLTNILQNALKYGAGHPITIACQRDGSHARAIITDRGIGIDPADLDRIFGRFERAVSSAHYGGLGLGLYIAQQLVLAHGGAITVDSEPGRGSAFTISLPV